MEEAQGVGERKRSLVTGANSGIGFETARALAQAGHEVILACRSQERGERALAQLEEELPQASLALELVDLASLESIRAFGARIDAGYDRIDVLVNNAGVFCDARRETEDGFEMCFGVNHLGTFAVTNLLLDRLRASQQARVITVTSAAHLRGEIRFDDLHCQQKYSPFGAYAASKLANVLFANELASRFRGSPHTSNSVHPGMVNTNIGEGGIWGLFWTLTRPFQKSPQEGAKTSVYLALSPQVEQVSGKYFARCAQREPARSARDAALARRLWTMSAELTGIEASFS